MKRSSGGSTSFTFSRVSAYQHLTLAAKAATTAVATLAAASRGISYGVAARTVASAAPGRHCGGLLHRGTADESRRTARRGPRRQYLHHPFEGGQAQSEDLVERQFSAQRPNQLWVVGFTYVATWVGFVYVAFCIWRRMAWKQAACGRAAR